MCSCKAPRLGSPKQAEAPGRHYCLFMNAAAPPCPHRLQSRRRSTLRRRAFGPEKTGQRRCRCWRRRTRRPPAWRPCCTTPCSRIQHVSSPLGDQIASHSVQMGDAPHQMPTASCLTSAQPTAEPLDERAQYDKMAFEDFAAASCPQRGPFVVSNCCTPSQHCASAWNCGLLTCRCLHWAGCPAHSCRWPGPAAPVCGWHPAQLHPLHRHPRLRACSSQAVSTHL